MRLSSSWVKTIGGGVEGTSMEDLSDVMKRGSYASAIENRRKSGLDGMGRKRMSLEKWMVMNR